MFARAAATLAFASVLWSCGGADDAKAIAAAHAAEQRRANAVVVSELPDARFDRFSERLLKDLLATEPTVSTQMGDHDHDGEWPDKTAEGDARKRAHLLAWQHELAGLRESRLTKSHEADAMILANTIDYALFAIDELKDYDRDPTAWTNLVSDGLDPLVTRDFQTPEERLANLKKRLDGVPALLEVAKSRLASSPRIMTETAVQQNAGLVDLCEHDVFDRLANTPEKRARIEPSARAAADALKRFGVFLEKDLLPRSNGDFRLGRAKFEKKLHFELGDDVDIDAVAKDAKKLLDDTREEMVATATELWPELMKGVALKPPSNDEEKRALVKTILDKLAEDRPSNATILRDADRLLGETTAFVRSHDLVTLPSEPVRVIEMPEYRRGVAVAYCDSSGPLEKKPETVYAISPTPKDWPPERALSFYREYNESMLAELTIHEAMPGHYLQLMHNAQSPSKIRAVFQSGPFVEGWAVYGEWLMAKYGFGGAKVRMQRQKMVLRLAANAILDHDIHAGNMDERAALDLMMKDAFQEEGEAVGKWRRARLTSAQLTTYFYGFSQMLSLRREFEKKPGFTERAYHDRLLSFGSPTMKVTRFLMSE